MAKQNLNFKLKKNPQAQLMPILGRTASNLGGYTAGKLLNKNIQSEKIKPVFKGIGMILVGMGAQLVDNEFVDAAGLGMTTAGFDVFINNTSSEKVKSYAAKVGLSGTSEEDDTDTINWDEAYQELEDDEEYGPESEDMEDDEDYQEEEEQDDYAPDAGMSGQASDDNASMFT